MTTGTAGSRVGPGPSGDPPGSSGGPGPQGGERSPALLPPFGGRWLREARKPGCHRLSSTTTLKGPLRPGGPTSLPLVSYVATKGHTVQCTNTTQLHMPVLAGAQAAAPHHTPRAQTGCSSEGQDFCWDRLQPSAPALGAGKCCGGGSPTPAGAWGHRRPLRTAGPHNTAKRRDPGPGWHSSALVPSRGPGYAHIPRTPDHTHAPDSRRRRAGDRQGDSTQPPLTSSSCCRRTGRGTASHRPWSACARRPSAHPAAGLGW